MVRSVAYFPDETPVRFVYTDDSFTEEYQYRRVYGCVKGDTHRQSILIPVNEHSTEPPKLVLDKMQKFGLTVEPESMVDIKQDPIPRRQATTNNS